MTNMFIMRIVTNSLRMCVADRERQKRARERETERKRERDGKACVKVVKQ